MKRPLIMIIVAGFLLGLVGAGIYLYFSRNTSASVISPGGEPTPTIAPTLVSWDDAAGFTMQYPEGLMVNKHDEDKVNYAHVEFTDSAHPGGLTVWVTDLPKGVTDTVSWGKKAATPSSAISFDTTLGDQPAQKVLIADTPKKVLVGTVWDGVLWYIEANLADETYWQQVFDTVTNSFAFVPLAETPAGSDAGSGAGSVTTEQAFDEEEVLE